MKTKRKKKKGSILVSFFRGIAVLLVVLLGVGISALTYLQSNALTIYDNGTNTGEEVEEVEITEPVNILVYGIDDLTDDGPRRSDTMMILHYDPKTSKITIVSLPRDTMVPSSVYSDSSLGRKVKLGEVHGFESADGDLNNAASKLTRVINKTFGITINYFVRVDYKALAAVVDSIGGVTVVPEYNMKYQEYKVASMGLVVDFDKGKEYVLDGKKAQEFLRWRKNDPGIPSGSDGSDLGRSRNQRIFIKALVDKMSTPSGLLKIPSVIKKASEYVGTNVPPSSMVNYALAFTKLGTSNIDFKELKGDTPDVSTTNGVSYFVYDSKGQENKELMNVLNGKSSEVTTYADVSKLNVKIINANGITGLAKNLKDKLVNELDYRDENFTTETSDSSVKSSTIVINKNIKVNESELKKLTGITKIEYTSDSDTDITITLGKNYSTQ